MEGPARKLDRKTGMKVLKRILSYLFRYKWLALLAFCMMLVSNLLALAGPRISGYAIDALAGKFEGNLIWEPLFDLCTSFFESETVGRVFYYCLLMVGAYLISAVLSFGLASLMIVISQKVISAMRRELALPG